MRQRKGAREGSTDLAVSLPKVYGPLVRRWVLILIHLGGGLFDARRNRPEPSREAFEAAGLKDIPEILNSRSQSRKDKAKAGFEAALREAFSRPGRTPSGTLLSRNLAWLAQAVGLSKADVEILHLRIIADLHPGLDSALEQLGRQTLGSLHSVLSILLDIPLRTVAKALDPSGALVRSGLVTLDLADRFSFQSKFELSYGLQDRLTVRNADPRALFRYAFVPGRTPDLALADYPHLEKDLATLKPYLGEAIKRRRPGVNILIYGPPGTGKTELVRALAAELGASLSEVASERPNGEPLEGSDRFRGYRLAQTVLGGGANQLILFDEIEDVFRPREDESRRGRSNASGLKAWVNKTLEENRAPAFWVTNRIHILDDAFIRRFDYVLRLDNPPRSIRRRMLERGLGNLPVRPTSLERLAEHEGLSPALITRTAKVVQAVHAFAPEADTDLMVNQALGNVLEAMGQPRTVRQAAEVVTAYRPELLNADCDLARVLEGLRVQKQGRLCFYGPPGTGKTAFGHHLAVVLDRPLHVKRASDLLSMWVGGTEQNLSRMFEEAAAEQAVLLLDEADGFLQDRGGAQRSWEVTQVNEMLTQMEAFQGVFIASTNLMDRLDAAALRRFDFKVRFGYLREDQAWEMFLDSARIIGVQAPPDLKERMRALRAVTPGDFATVIRQARLNPPSTGNELIARLESECRAKPESRRKAVGF